MMEQQTLRILTETDELKYVAASSIVKHFQHETLNIQNIRKGDDVLVWNGEFKKGSAGDLIKDEYRAMVVQPPAVLAAGESSASTATTSANPQVFAVGRAGGSASTSNMLPETAAEPCTSGCSADNTKDDQDMLCGFTREFARNQFKAGLSLTIPHLARRLSPANAQNETAKTVVDSCRDEGPPFPASAEEASLEASSDSSDESEPSDLSDSDDPSAPLLGKKTDVEKQREEPSHSKAGESPGKAKMAARKQKKLSLGKRIQLKAVKSLVLDNNLNLQNVVATATSTDSDVYHDSALFDLAFASRTNKSKSTARTQELMRRFCKWICTHAEFEELRQEQGFQVPEEEVVHKRERVKKFAGGSSDNISTRRSPRLNPDSAEPAPAQTTSANELLLTPTKTKKKPKALAATAASGSRLA
ncbi:uncharacterized protein LOC132203817 isoform X3 [Neocloeon triangulifer]|uniref:uncharacterized protein LOC132203817 isoform X3 n=1 Tax=Neocloeon triangulifer TaxID=2078957 RepID=UPI00286F983F|nr:uncharacterized protein LOC132203817 isoform X3 [Neocloeon triangulifer]